VQEYKDIMQMLGEAREATTSSTLRASSGTNAVCRQLYDSAIAHHTANQPHSHVQ
jgi:hypothetical protein